jgi:hypothetical protein
MFIEVNSLESELSNDQVTTSSIEYTPREGGLAERLVIPYPGKKVKGYWDEESDKEN